MLKSLVWHNTPLSTLKSLNVHAPPPSPPWFSRRRAVYTCALKLSQRAWLFNVGNTVPLFSFFRTINVASRSEHEQSICDWASAACLNKNQKEVWNCDPCDLGSLHQACVFRKMPMEKTEPRLKLFELFQPWNVMPFSTFPRWPGMLLN